MKTAPDRRRFRWSLRTMVVTVAAAGSLGAKWFLHDVRSEVEAKVIDHLVNTTTFRKDQLSADAFPDGDAWVVYVYYVPATPDFMWTLHYSAKREFSE